MSVDEAVCYVPRAGSLHAEYRRKVRTMARGLSTLWYERSLLNPFRYGRFAWMLASHKLIRWFVWLTWPAALAGLVLLTLAWPVLWPVTLVAGAVLALGWIGWRMARSGRTLGPLAPAAYVLAGAVAGFNAWTQALRGRRHAIWEPTRR